MPQPGDIVIRVRPTSPPTWVLTSVDGPEEIVCDSHADAMYQATSYAETFRVNVWSAGGGRALDLLTRYRPGDRRTGGAVARRPEPARTGPPDVRASGGHRPGHRGQVA